MTDLPKPGRRRLLGALATLPFLAQAGHLLMTPGYANPVIPSAVQFPHGVTLLMAGPADGPLARWASAVRPVLEQALPADTSIRCVSVGGPDGVTGANQLEARGTQDGLMVLLVPGQAALAWLVGDPRAQFDVAHWVPVMAGVSSGIVMGRLSNFAAGRRIRIAASGPVGPELPALLGLDLLGVPPDPIGGLGDPRVLRTALGQDAVDAVFLRGPNVPEQMAALATTELRPLFATGFVDEAGMPARDPAFPDVPHLSELIVTRFGRRPGGPLFDAWCATAAASQLEFGLMLPQLTPAAMVALWRRAGAEAAAAPAVQTLATPIGVRLMGGSMATANGAAIATDSAALLELRGWLASRFNWRPTP